MNNKPKVLLAFGTRPEAIKFAPVIKQLEILSDRIKTIVCVTAQHRKMLDQVLKLFEIKPDYDLDLMTYEQTLAELTSKVLLGMTKVIKNESPDFVLVQGDTTTTFVSALSAYYLKIPVAHIEAGLRTNDKYSPYPEEINRHLTSSICDFHFAPTTEARNNLIKEKIPAKSILVTGNTVIDALKWVQKRNASYSNNNKWCNYFHNKYNLKFDSSRKTILVTGHRRESFGDGFRRICNALSELAKKNINIQIVYPVHLNPNVQDPVYSILGNRSNIHLMEPLDYEPFVFLMNKCYLILTDSGGIQEEAPAMGKPVFVMRDTTERLEGIIARTSKLVGTTSDKIVSAVEMILFNEEKYNRMSKASNLYGDGNAAKKIIDFLLPKLLVS